MDIFLITFREGLEASIIIGIIYAILKGLGVENNKKKYIAAGIIAGVIMSLFFAGGFEYFFGGFEGKAEKIYEGSLMLIACLMISHFVLWMHKHFNFVGSLTTHIKKTISKGELWMLSILVFVSIIREGVETVIFLNALDFSLGNLSDIILALSGIVGAISISVILFFFFTKSHIAGLLRYTNFLLVIIAGGLLAHSIVEFQGAGVIPTFIKPFIDLSAILPESTGIGSILKAGFSYDANPSLLAFISHIGYISIFLFILYFQKKPQK